MDIRARIKITSPADSFFRWLRATHVIAELRVIESQLHETNKRNRTGSGNLRGNGSNEFRMPCAHGKLQFHHSKTEKSDTPSLWAATCPSLGVKGGSRLALGSTLSQGRIRKNGWYVY